jgi:cytochrome c-type biogenesis protein
MDLAARVQEIISSTNVPLLAAFLVGLVAAVGPCPLATNIAALSYTAQQFTRRSAVLASGVLYALGRAAGYTLVGVVVLAAGAQISRVATGLQGAADVLLGPFLVLAGLILLDVIHLRAGNTSAAWARIQERVARWPAGGAFVLGFLFALAFCPYSATLFFGILIPLALRTTYGVALPVAFGIGTAMPVLVLGVPLALGLGYAARGVEALTRIERYVRVVGGLAFILAGLYSISRLF